jgi:hypothetical protein
VGFDGGQARDRCTTLRAGDIFAPAGIDDGGVCRAAGEDVERARVIDLYSGIGNARCDRICFTGADDDRNDAEPLISIRCLTFSATKEKLNIGCNEIAFHRRSFLQFGVEPYRSNRGKLRDQPHGKKNLALARGLHEPFPRRIIWEHCGWQANRFTSAGSPISPPMNGPAHSRPAACPGMENSMSKWRRLWNAPASIF